MKRSISMSLAGVAAATTLVAGVGTTAVFGDGEVRDGSVTSGTLDLLVGDDCTTLEDTDTKGHTIVSGADFAPGQTITRDLCVKNAGSLPGTLVAEVASFTQTEGAECTEPEILAEGKSLAADGTGSDCGSKGELGKYLDVTVSQIDCADGAVLGAEPKQALMTYVSQEFALDGNSEACFSYAITFRDEAEQNEAQSDVAAFNVEFDLQQNLVEDLDETTIPAPQA